jgi:hypothetical protein
MAGNPGFGVGIDKQVESDQMGGRCGELLMRLAARRMRCSRSSTRKFRRGHYDPAINYKFFDWTLAAPSSRGK